MESLLTITSPNDHQQLAISYHFPHRPLDPYLFSQNLQATGSFISDLKFNQRFLLEDIAHDDILELKCSGYYLNQIIQHCNNLLHLSMQQAQLLQLNSTTEQFVNESIVCIELSNCEICNGVFHEMSSRLPSLKQLSLLHCTFYNNVKDWKSGETA